MTIFDMHDKVAALRTDVIVTEVMIRSKGALVDEQQIQLSEGLYNDGLKIGDKYSYRSNVYAALKNKMNPLPGEGNPDLKLTGAFYKGIKLNLSGTKLTFSSTDSKAGDLEKKYSSEIFGLDDESRQVVIDETINPVFLTNIRDKLGL